MTLSQRQRLFARLLPRLIDFAYEQGYEVTLGDAYRDPRVHGPIGVKLGYGHKDSNHKNRLAVDLNLFKGGTFLQTTADHAPLGEFWEKLHPLCRWGGRFNDGNHYSIESPEGMK
jgi:hypothetical protein